MAINFDFRSGAKKSGHLDYPLQSYGPKFVNMHIWAYLQIWGSKFMATLFSKTIDFDQPFENALF